MRKGRGQVLSLVLHHWQWGISHYTKVLGPMRLYKPTSLIPHTVIAYAGGPGSISVPWLCFFGFLTGVGGCAAFAGAVKTCETQCVNMIAKGSHFQPL